MFESHYGVACDGKRSHVTGKFGLLSVVLWYLVELEASSSSFLLCRQSYNRALSLHEFLPWHIVYRLPWRPSWYPRVSKTSPSSRLDRIVDCPLPPQEIYYQNTKTTKPKHYTHHTIRCLLTKLWVMSRSTLPILSWAITNTLTSNGSKTSQSLVLL